MATLWGHPKRATNHLFRTFWALGAQMSGFVKDLGVFWGVLVLDLFFEGLKVEKVRFLGGANL